MTQADIAKVNVTELIVSQVRGIDPRKLPANVLEAARHSLLDWCGIAIAGATEPLVLSSPNSACALSPRWRCSATIRMTSPPTPPNAPPAPSSSSCAIASVSSRATI